VADFLQFQNSEHLFRTALQLKQAVNAESQMIVFYRMIAEMIHVTDVNMTTPENIQFLEI
jgi:hypothetical protein